MAPPVIARRSSFAQGSGRPVPKPRTGLKVVGSAGVELQPAQSPTTLPGWAEQLTATPPRSDELSSDGTHRMEGQRQGVVHHEDWELRTETMEETYGDGHGAVKHAKQLHHYRTLLIRAQSSSSAELHDVHSRLHHLQRSYDILQEEHATCSSSPGSVASGGLEGLKEMVQSMSKEERVQLLGEVVAACHPSDVDSQIALLQKYKRSCWDILGRVDDEVSARILSLLDLPEIKTLRLVSKRYNQIARTPALWKRMCRQLGVAPLSDWEAHFRHVWRRELCWREGTPQAISMLSGHTTYVTSLKLYGDLLISGSYDGTIRLWHLGKGHSPQVLPGKSVSCLDYWESDNVLVSGSHDLGRVQVWRKKDTWQIERTLSGHLHGIRAIAVNSKWLVSAGADKAIVIWNWRTGEKIVKFGQQTNICIGVQLVEDYVIAMTVDGIIRTFSIDERDMIGQYRLVDLVPELVPQASGVTVHWFEGRGRSMTCGTRNLVIELEWDEIPPGVAMPSKMRQALTPVRQRTMSALSPSTPTKITPTKASTLSPIASSHSSFSAPRKVAGQPLSTPKTSHVHLPVITRPPRLVRVIEAPEIERGAVDGARIVTSTRFAARSGADRQLYVTSQTADGPPMIPIGGAWSGVADELGLQTPGKNPMSIAMDRDKIAYGCTDGSIVIVNFTTA